MPEIFMDVDTALAEVPVNLLPLIDDTDFKTRETGITYNQAGMDLVWNFVSTAGAMSQTAVAPTSAGDYDWAHQGDGIYSIEITASGGASINNDTEGHGWFSGICTGVLPWRGPVICFRAAGLNDKLIDSAYSTTRGLTGTAVPDATADAAGGLAISDAGGLDLDDLPTTAEFEARSIASADYVVVGDTIAGVTLCTTCTTNTDMVTAAPTAEAVVNEWETQSQADPTGFHVNVKEVSDTAQTANDNGADINTILERVITLTSGTAAVNTTAINSPDGFVITTGTGEVNNEDSTYEEDGIVHSILPSGGVIDVYYIFDVGTYGIPVSAKWIGYVNAQGDSFSVHAWNWISSAWEQAGSTDEAPGAVNITGSFDLTTSHVGTGGDIGKVHIRGYSTDATKLATDRILCSYAIDVTSLILDIQGTGFVKDTHSLPQCITATGFSVPNEYDAVISTAQDDLDVLTGADGATLATVQDNYAPNTVVPDAAGTSATPAEVATALTDIHLDHLLAVDYDPASKPGVATALLNELVESDGGVSRYTENALEQGPSGTGGDATEAKQDTIITHLTDVKGGTFAGGTDSLEAIRDRGDSAWTTGAGGSDRLLMVDTTIATLASQTSFTLAGGSTDDNAYRNCTVVIEDASTGVQKAIGLCSAYTGATKTVTLKYDPSVFTMATFDKVYILAENALKSTDANRQLDVTASGTAGIDWGNVENKTAVNELSATDIQLCETVTTNTDNADILDITIDGTVTVQQALMLFLSVLAGKSDGAKTALQHFRNTLDTKNRITAVVDGSGNRTSITLDLT